MGVPRLVPLPPPDAATVRLLALVDEAYAAAREVCALHVEDLMAMHLQCKNIAVAPLMPPGLADENRRLADHIAQSVQRMRRSMANGG